MREREKLWIIKKMYKFMKRKFTLLLDIKLLLCVLKRVIRSFIHTFMFFFLSFPSSLSTSSSSSTATAAVSRSSLSNFRNSCRRGQFAVVLVKMTWSYKYWQDVENFQHDLVFGAIGEKFWRCAVGIIFIMKFYACCICLGNGNGTLKKII